MRPSYQDMDDDQDFTPIPGQPVGRGLSALALVKNDKRSPFMIMVMLSVFLHLFITLVLWGGMLLLQFLGFDFSMLEALPLKPRDIEFVLVDSPTQPPRDPNTKNRSDRASRSGGEKVKNQPIAEPKKKAGSPQAAQQTPKPAQQPQRQVVQKPRPQMPPPTPVPQLKPIQKPSPPEAAKAPPKPKLPQPPKLTSRAPVLPPNPMAPAIKMPSAPTPNVNASVPVATASGSGRGQQRGVPTPSQISGRTSVGSRASVASASGAAGNVGSAGAARGAGGQNAYNQSGSPGGGGGRPGIDALPDPDYGSYMAELQRRIKRNWRPPSAQEDKRVVVLFKISRDGRLISVTIDQTSGYQEADQAALAAVRLSAPFRPLPVGHLDNDLAVQFTFDYNVYKSRASGIRQR